MSQAGTLNIRFGRDPAAGVQLSIESTRPQGLSHLLQNRTIAEAHQVVSLLFSVCRRAQTVAASRVAEQLLGIVVPSELERCREHLLCLELLHEHLWTLLVQLPTELGLPAHTEIMAEASQRLRCAMSTMDRRGVLSGIYLASGDGSEQRPEAVDLAGWATQMSVRLFGEDSRKPAMAGILREVTAARDWRSDYRLLGVHRLDREELVNRLMGAPVFGHQPQWPQQPRETGAVVRQATDQQVSQALQQGWCLQPRLLAILLEVQRLLKWLSGESGVEFSLTQGGIEPSSSRFALAQLETARGGLIHVVQLTPDRARIQRYWIIAPTDWNFHPQGVLHTMAESLQETEEAEARQRLSLLVTMMNPCVGWEVQGYA